MKDENEPFAYNNRDLIAAGRSGNFEAYLKTAHRKLEGDSWDTLVSDALDAHRSGEIDIATALTAVTEGRIGYGTQRFMEDALPRLQIELDTLLALISSLSARSPSEGVPYYLMNAFSAWCDADPSHPTAALSAIRAGAAPTDLTRAVLHSGLRVDRMRFLPLLLSMISNGAADEYDVAADVLGRFEQLTSDELDRVVAGLQQDLMGASGERATSVLKALLSIAIRSPENGSIGEGALQAVAGRSDAYVREAIASAFMFAIGKAANPLASTALGLLLDTESGETVTLDAIDHILSKALFGPVGTEANELIDRLLARRIATIDSLDSTKHALLTDDSGVRLRTISRWLISSDLAHFAAVNDMCMGVGENATRFELDFSSHALSRDQAERIARRSCALLMVFPETVASILVSLMRTGPAEALPEIERLLFDPLLINYWSGPRTYLESVLPKAPSTTKRIIKRVLDLQDRYMAAVEAVRDLPELRPSGHHRFLVETKRREESQAIGKAAQRQSIFANIFPTSILLYGDSAIFDVYVEPGKTVRQETPLASHEVSHELPRIEVIDPFGSWYQREHLLRDEGDE